LKRVSTKKPSSLRTKKKNSFEEKKRQTGDSFYANYFFIFKRKHFVDIQKTSYVHLTIKITTGVP